MHRHVPSSFVLFGCEASHLSDASSRLQRPSNQFICLLNMRADGFVMGHVRFGREGLAFRHFRPSDAAFNLQGFLVWVAVCRATACCVSTLAFLMTDSGGPFGFQTRAA